jgi:hypothetical protein
LQLTNSLPLISHLVLLMVFLDQWLVGSICVRRYRRCEANG